MAAAGDQDATEDATGGPLRILHVMRAPVGGLFRHVVDLSRAQAQAGHSVGIVADSMTGGAVAARILEEMSPLLALGVRRMPMRRLPHPDDLRVAWRVAKLVQSLAPDVVHGHGAKGGLFTRLPAIAPGFPHPERPVARVYTPHGGSLHFRPEAPIGRLFFTAERMMSRVTDLIPFESDYARRRFIETIGAPTAYAPVVHNGLAEREFTPVTLASDATDFVFVGEMRVSKGVDTLLEAFATLPETLRLTLVGSGRDEGMFRALAERLGVAGRVTFLGPAPGPEALGRGRILVMPSRAESLPYIVLEAIAARVPIIATRVGGIPEIFGAEAHRLVPPEDAYALAGAMSATLESPDAARRKLADDMAAFVRAGFTIDLMTKGVLKGYCKALAAARARPGASAIQLRMGE